MAETIVTDARIQTHSGRMVNVCNVKHEDIHLGDIAQSLSRLARFNGHTMEFYSVAQHSVIVRLLVEREAKRLPPDVALKYARWGLLHDAHEAYIGDIASPLRPLCEQLVGCKYGIDQQVRKYAGMPEYPDKDEARIVGQADLAVLAIERRDLMFKEVPWRGFDVKPPVDMRINRCLSDTEAEDLFLDRYEELFGVSSRTCTDRLQSGLYERAGLVIEEPQMSPP